MEQENNHYLIFRFSAIGDVAMTAPIIKAYAQENKSSRFTVVSQPFLKPLFEGVDNVDFFAADIKKEYKGFTGLFKLFLDLKKIKPTHILDFHKVLRSIFLSLLFAICFKPVIFIKKGKRDKWKLVRRFNKELKPVVPMIRRYELTILKAGFKDLKIYESKPKRTTNESSDVVLIGVAPFAKHKGKTWPINSMEQVIAQLSDNPKYKIYLFGGGKHEVSVLSNWEQKYSGVHSVAGQLKLKEELELISRLNLMVTMDSANMHFASGVGTPVISIWGATHHYAGFYGWGQDEKNIISDDISCRPCSVFGNKKCYRGDYACLNNIRPFMVVNRIDKFIQEEVQ